MGPFRKIKDILRLLSTYGSAFLVSLLLVGIFIYVGVNGAPLLNFDLLVSDYNSQTYTYESTATSYLYSTPSLTEGEYYSSSWGIALEDGTDRTGASCVNIAYLDASSPLAKLSKNVVVGSYFTKAAFVDKNENNLYALQRDGAKEAITTFENASRLVSFSITTKGGGIRGSFLSTLLVIFLSLFLAMPLGILSAIYFVYFAKKGNKLVFLLERMIEITSGIPSIIFGLVGVAVFIPLSNALFLSHGGNLISGCLTLVIILLPTIVKSTEEALKAVPKSYRTSSLALGGSERQTLRKVLLPSALPGILTAGVLSAGRIIGESAALVFAIGTYISDSVSLNANNATLAVMMWSVISGEYPNYALASAIALLVLLIILALSLLARLFSYVFLKKRGLA
jgi:phosphate transport system permease protein